MISSSLENEIVKNELLGDKVDDELIKLKDFQKIIDIIEKKEAQIISKFQNKELSLYTKTKFTKNII